MLNRFVYGVVAILALITIVAVDARWADTADSRRLLAALVRHGSLIPPAITGVILLGVVELGRLLRELGHRPRVGWAAFCCMVLMLSPWFCAGEVLGNSPVDVEGLQWQVVWLMFAVVGTLVVHLRDGVSPTAVSDTSATLFVILYLGLLPSFAVQLRSDANLGHPAAGAWTLLLILMTVFGSDIAALYVGKALGRRRLAPRISPGKSVAGFVGGVCGSIVVGIGVYAASQVAPVSETPMPGDPLRQLAAEATRVLGGLTLPQMIGFAAAMSVISQVGDLFESLIKRSAQVKDSSRLIPGMGGVLDVIDGAVFAVPLAWFLLTRVWHVV